MADNDFDVFIIRKTLVFRELTDAKNILKSVLDWYWQ